MTVDEHILTTFAEECNECAQRISKALRFGLDEVQSGKMTSNTERIISEYADVVAMYELCVERGIFPDVTESGLGVLKKMKKKKFLEYLDYSKKQGRVDE